MRASIPLDSQRGVGSDGAALECVQRKSAARARMEDFLARMDRVTVSPEFIDNVHGPKPERERDVREEAAAAIGCAADSADTDRLMTLLRRAADNELFESERDRLRYLQQHLHSLVARVSARVDLGRWNVSDEDAAWLLLVRERATSGN